MMDAAAAYGHVDRLKHHLSGGDVHKTPGNTDCRRPTLNETSAADARLVCKRCMLFSAYADWQLANVQCQHAPG